MADIFDEIEAAPPKDIFDEIEFGQPTNHDIPPQDWLNPVFIPETVNPLDPLEKYGIENPSLKEAIMSPLTLAGDIVRGGVADLAAGLSAFKRPEGMEVSNLPSLSKVQEAVSKNAPFAVQQSGNLPAAITGDALPVDAMLAEASTESPAAATTGKVSQGLAASAPLMAVMPQGALGKLVAAGFTADMLSHARPDAIAFGEEMGKPPEQRDYDKLTTALSSLIQTTAFAPAAGAHAAVQPIRAATRFATEKFAPDRAAINELARQLATEPLERAPQKPTPIVERADRLQMPQQIEAPKPTLPPVRPGDQRIQIQQPDGTVIEAVTNGKDWEVGGQKIPNVGRPVDLGNGQVLWSDGPLRPGERILSTETQGARGGEPIVVPPETTKTSMSGEPPTTSGEQGASQPRVTSEPAREPNETKTPEGEMVGRSVDAPTTEGLPPETIGMGGATPAEFLPPKPFKTSNKNATVDAERKQRGLPPMMETERRSNQSAWDEAMQKIDDNPVIQDELITELSAEPRAVTPTENAMLMHRRIDLRNEYEKSLRNWKEAFETDDFVRAAEESQRVKDWSSKLSDLEEVTKRTGAESGRSLQARRMMAREDYSLAAMELRAMEAKGRNLTPDEHLQLIKAQERIAELEAKLTELESGRASKETEKLTDDALKEVSSSAPREAKSKDFDVNREADLLGSIQKKVEKGQLDEITPLVQKLARVFWRRGIRQREPMIDALHGALKTIIPEFTRDDTKRAFSGYGNFTPLSKEAIDVGLRDLRGQTQQVLKLEALEARKPLEKTGQERRVPSDEERRLIKQVNELKRKYGVVVTDPATQLKSALQSRKTYYEHRIADLKHEIATRERIVKTKTESPRDAELDRLIAEHERLKEEHDSIFGKRELTDEQKLKIALAAAERSRAQWEARLKNAEKGVFTKRTPKQQISNAELDVIRAEAAAMREHVKELEALSKPKKSKEEIALATLKTRMLNQTTDLLRRIEQGDFTKKTKREIKLDKEALEIQALRDTAKQEFKTALEKDRWAKMSVFDKTRRKVADVYDAARAIMTTGELSFILRQGKLAALSRPIQTSKALPDMFRALLANEKRAREIDLQVHNHPDAAAARAAKLHLVEEGLSLHKQEEILMGRLVGKIPVVKNFNHAAQVFLNRIRFDMWRAMRKSMSKSGTPTLAEDKQIAMFVNEATGRGGLGKMEAYAVPLARAMFSPRYFASRLQLAAGHSLWGGTMRTRRIIATEYARALVGLGLYYTMLSAYFGSGNDDPKRGSVELDPRSARFGKVQVGDTTVDPLAGLAQVATFAARTGTTAYNVATKSNIPEVKTGAGEMRNIRGPDLRYGQDRWSDLALNFARSKAHPVPGAIANLFDGTDLGGDEATVINQAQNMVAPITYIDIYAALKEQDLDDATAMALLAILGEGLQTYKRDDKTSK